MKRILLYIIAILGLYLTSIAHPVDLQTARSVASKFMKTNDLQLVSTYQTDKNVASFYVFNTTDSFVIIAADDCETPIIGYSHEGRFDPNNVPVQMEEYLQDFAAIIQYGIENHIEADETTARQWELVKATGRLNDQKTNKSIAPLLTTKWHQGCLYNSLCPTISGPCDHAEVGCVAVAMGQIMRYWRYPATGWGTNAYTNAGTTLSADFGNTSYDWDHMPDSLTENSTEAEIEAVATLLYHCGVSVKMFYNSNGSGANAQDVTDAMRRYFSYSRNIHFEKQKNYSNDEWLSLLRNDLDLQRPVLYSGSGSAGGHSFVCDGYDDNDLLHFNWGWGRADGYFALGNLNPLGYTFNKNNTAIFDIIPQYEPCLVFATSYPTTGGIIEGAGEYHIGEQCTLTAIPSENYGLYCWKRDGQYVSNPLSFTFTVNKDTLNIEALFSCLPVSQITANYAPDASNPFSSSVGLSWTYEDSEWPLLKQFGTDEECSGVVSDGEHIYVTYAYWDPHPFSFGKYTMDGELLERFNLEGIPDASSLGYDGTNFYCNAGHSGLSLLYTLDFYNKTVIDSTAMSRWFGSVTYDPEYDGFWLGHDYGVLLYNRQGQIIKTSPTLEDYIYGVGYYTAQDGNPHLLLTRTSGIYNYDINSNLIYERPLVSIDWDYTYGLGAHVGKYDGKDAIFVAIDHSIRIYEIKNTNEQMEHSIGYRIYRSDSEGHTVMLADGIEGASYIDNSWENAATGLYRFGISRIFENGGESEIIWSEPIEKQHIGISEHENDNDSNVQKVIENGHIIIIKDGKRYTVTGQQLN